MAQQNIAEALHHLVSGIVENPDSVQVHLVETDYGHLLEVSTDPADLGRVIGRRGRTVHALRTVISALAQGERVRVEILNADAASNKAN